MPPATIVKPIMASLTFNERAIAEALSTNTFEPNTKQPSPIIIINVAFTAPTGSVAVASSCTLSSLRAPRSVIHIKPTNNINNTAASTRLMLLSIHITINATEAKIAKGISRFIVTRKIAIGATIAVQPTMRSVLKILLPTTFPTAKSAVPLIAESKLTKNSGAEVPAATIVKPIIICGIPKREAMPTAPDVSLSAPQSTTPMPATSNKICSHIEAGAKLKSMKCAINVT